MIHAIFFGAFHLCHNMTNLVLIGTVLRQLDFSEAPLTYEKELAVVTFTCRFQFKISVSDLIRTRPTLGLLFLTTLPGAGAIQRTIVRAKKVASESGLLPRSAWSTC